MSPIVELPIGPANADHLTDPQRCNGREWDRILRTALANVTTESELVDAVRFDREETGFQIKDSILLGILRHVFKWGKSEEGVVYLSGRIVAFLDQENGDGIISRFHAAQQLSKILVVIFQICV